MLVAVVPSPSITLAVLGTLLVVLAASGATFWLLVRRATSHRQWVAFSEWARDAGLDIRPRDRDRLPPPLDAIGDQRPIVRLRAGNDAVLLLQIQTAAPRRDATVTSEAVIWNLLVHRLQTAWQPTGMRPASASRSILDLFSLSSFPLLGTTERFVVFGTDSGAARVLSQSMARSLLPPDIGLLLHGRQMVLDFSGRPFDTIELNRMLALAQQLAQKLPAPA